MPDEYVRPASMVYTAQDTVAIYNLVNKYVSCLKSRDFVSASNMLYNYSNDTLRALNADQKKDFLGFYTHIPIYDIDTKYLLLHSDRDNEVKLTMQIVKSGSIKEDRGVTHLSLNPVKKGNKWYLTLLDNKSLRVSEFEK